MRSFVTATMSALCDICSRPSTCNFPVLDLFSRLGPNTVARFDESILLPGNCTHSNAIYTEGYSFVYLAHCTIVPCKTSHSYVIRAEHMAAQVHIKLDDVMPLRPPTQDGLMHAKEYRWEDNRHAPSTDAQW